MEPYRQPRNVGDDSWSGVGDGFDSDAGGITPAGAGEEAFDTILFRHTFPYSQQGEIAYYSPLYPLGFPKKSAQFEA
jgi:hypothetical protein